MILSAEAESTATIMEALTAVFRRSGLPQALYSDRASWAAHTPVRNEPVDRTKITQVGRALKRLGVEHILAYSPQARGRSERVNRTLQDRLVNEMRLHGIRTMEAANRYIAEHFLPSYNLEFGRAPSDPASAFVSLGGADLNQILCFEEERVVQRTIPSAATGSGFKYPNSAAAPPVPASRSSSGATSTRATAFGAARSVLPCMTHGDGSRPPPKERPLRLPISRPERPHSRADT